MLMNSSDVIPCRVVYAVCRRRPSTKRPNIQIRRLNRRRRWSKEAKEEGKVGVVKREMEMKNWKLYMKNKSIIEENDKLRNKALLLHQENQALLSLLNNNLSHPHSSSSSSSGSGNSDS